jgi:hypothetical protein
MRRWLSAAVILCVLLLSMHCAANAQDKGTVNPEPLPPLTKQHVR